MNRLLREPISMEALQKGESDPACGAVVTFEGRVRREAAGGQKTRALFYEAFPELALKVFDEIRQEAIARWPLRCLEIVHRVGELAVGEIAVVVRAASPHRREAFEACSYALEELKKRAPIWKKEIYEDATEAWVGHGDWSAAGRGKELPVR